MRQDTIEDIQMCLRCEKFSCTNCLQNRSPARMGRPPKTVKRVRGSSVEYFDGVSAAASVMGCSNYYIQAAIKSGKTFWGYEWSYA